MKTKHKNIGDMANDWPTKNSLFGKFGSYSLTIGILLVVLGFAGVAFPVFISLATSLFVAWLLIIGGVFWVLHTYTYSRRSVTDWLKPVLLLVTGGLLLIYPAFGVETIALLMAIYLLLSAFGSFSLARFTYPARAWMWMTFSGVVSLLLATLFLVGWPTASLWLVGLYIGISLLFDGWTLVAIGWAVRKGEKS